MWLRRWSLERFITTYLGFAKMKDSQTIEFELKRICEETKMKAEAFYQKHNIIPDQKKNNCVFDHQEEEVSYTVFSNKTSNLY